MIIERTLLIPELETVGSADDDDGVTADEGRSTAVPGVVALEYRALPGELILCSVLTSNYPGVGHSTTWHVVKFF